MKPGSDAAAVGRAPERDEFVSRKLIRPPLHRSAANPASSQAITGTAQINGSSNPGSSEKPAHARPDRKNGKHSPNSEHTHAENFYYQKQVQSKTLMTIALKTGEIIQGTIEWYDKNCIKVHRIGKPNLLLYKPAIRYMHKSEE